MQQNVSLGIRARVLLVIAAGLLMPPWSAETAPILQNIINKGGEDFNRELALNNARVIAGCFGHRALAPNNRYTALGSFRQGSFDAEQFSSRSEVQIAGFYANSMDQTVRLLGNVIPEPGSFALLGLGAVLVALGYRKRRS